MMKWMVKDYFTAFGWKRVMEMNKKNHIFVNIAIFIILIAFFETINGNEISQCFIALYVPTFFMFISQQIHPFVLLKYFYLCPMDKNERINLIARQRFVTIAIPVVFALLVNGILVLTGHCALGYGIGCVIHVYAMLQRYNCEWTNKGIKFFEKLEISDVLLIVFITMAYYNLFLDLECQIYWKMIILIGAEMIGVIVWHFDWRKTKKKMVNYESLSC